MAAYPVSEKSKGENDSRFSGVDITVPAQYIGSDEVPTFLGMSGKNLSLAVSVVATTGFLLFGYDRKSTEVTSSSQPHELTIVRGCHVWHYLS